VVSEECLLQLQLYLFFFSSVLEGISGFHSMLYGSFIYLYVFAQLASPLIQHWPHTAVFSCPLFSRTDLIKVVNTKSSKIAYL
jgi:hypothetical protein